MTIIVASLFLPYKAQFEVDATTSNETVPLIDSSLVKINSTDVGSKRRQSNPGNSNSPFLHGKKNISQEDVHKSPEPQTTTEENTFKSDGSLTSEQFIENLTSTTGNASNVVSSSIDTNNNKLKSVEEFFSSSKSSSSTTKDVSPLPSAAFQSDSPPVSIPLDAIPKSTVITPKSRSNPDINSAVMNIKKVQQRYQQLHNLPSMKRTSTAPVQRKTSFAPEGTNIETVNEEDEILQDDSSSETVSNHKYHVPKFGGYSHRSKLSFLGNSLELFKQLPWKIVPTEKGNGALKNAINIAVKEKTLTEPVSWVGTIGIPTDEIPKEISTKITETLQNDYNAAAVIMDDVTFKGAYKNFCKQILWPTLHYQIPDNPNSKAFEDHSWNYYQSLNQKFANKIIDLYKDGDTIWVHDYHLMLVPEMVRKAIPTAKIGFFLHVSFPSSEVFRCFAQREKILKGILGANSVSFQTKEYARHFLQTTNRLLMADVTKDDLKYAGKIVSVNSFPVGIDAFHLMDQLKEEKVSNWRKLIKERWTDSKLIISRDQFDKIRGISKKLLAYERFLRENPQYIDKVVLIQICLGRLKNDPELERQIMLIVDRINSLSSDISTSQPVVFLHQDLEFDQYLALNCEADMFWVNSLREGMNLTCHESIVSSEEKNSPLLLSEFTGSASVLKNGSLLINPWDTKDIANKIKLGLEMPTDVKKRNWKRLMKSVINNDSDNWILSSLQSIYTSWEFNKERSTVFSLSHKKLYSDLKETKKHLFIFKISEPPTPRVISTLNDLSSQNIVFVLNSFSKTTLETLYGRVTNLNLIAENGAYIRLNGSWHNIVEEVRWKSEVVKILDDKVERLPGSYYKIADSMIRFHTENAEDQDRVSGVVGEAITHINTLFNDKGIHAYFHKNIVFVQQKGLALSAVTFLLRFYNSTSDASVIRDINDDKSNLPITNIEDFAKSSNDLSSSQDLVDFACITGSSSPVIEPLFELLKQKIKKGSLKYAHSIVYGELTSTHAKERINGLNELFTILEYICKMKKDRI
ncbi:hypothetical protein KAFR_0D01680 [Kazachstania africana CBS 2517]|uniref:Uncharacterized protein n=1 Tax=Kazachstania africana (strain ATCC 22294 / BCRC 22015 / CBS 2517 / CECT 1963 / NBRC 1671 / NRRL Y-8276) TaxID=1071382 RepID=H2ATW5_KAZAF|nr:hypothetical protein KAFR_0D01680 [Kazachstania africana CBS 2517]CCF57815.1 hypothetical protein KAFR_0D01680 [Kazachstania africana CBS 2517]